MFSPICLSILERGMLHEISFIENVMRLTFILCFHKHYFQFINSYF